MIIVFYHHHRRCIVPASPVRRSPDMRRHLWIDEGIGFQFELCNITVVLLQRNYIRAATYLLLVEVVSETPASQVDILRCQQL